MAVKPSQRSGAWKTELVWENPAVAFYMSNPVLNGTLLFGMSHKNRGQFVALDAAKGKTVRRL